MKHLNQLRKEDKYNITSSFQPFLAEGKKTFQFFGKSCANLWVLFYK